MEEQIIEQHEDQRHQSIPELPLFNFHMTRSQSECQLRDREFYEMCDDEDEVAIYFKQAERNVVNAIHVSQLKNLPLFNQSTNHGGDAPIDSSNH